MRINCRAALKRQKSWQPVYLSVQSLRYENSVIQNHHLSALIWVKRQLSVNSSNEHMPRSNRLWTYLNCRHQTDGSITLSNGKRSEFFACTCGKSVSRLREYQEHHQPLPQDSGVSYPFRWEPKLNHPAATDQWIQCWRQESLTIPCIVVARKVETLTPVNRARSLVWAKKQLNWVSRTT